jgi:hypothetical protein
MEPRLEKELEEYIVQELLRSRDRDEIITEVCQRANILWVEGEYLLERTERENKALLREQKSPIRMFISILAAAVGLAWMIISLIRILSPLISYRMAAEPILQGYVWPAETAGLVIQVVVGVGMLVTGLILTIQQVKTIHR